MQDFRLLTAHIKFHQICTLIDSFCWKYIKIFAKKIQRSYVSLPWRLMQNLTKNWSVCFKNDRNLVNFDPSPWKSQNLHFQWFLLCKVFNVWPKKVQRSYLSWQWRGMQNLKENCLVVSKMTWGIWEIYTSAIESLKIRTLLGYFNLKQKMYEFKIYRGVICHDNEEWCKLWRGIDLSFQNWHELFEEFWLEHSEID